MENKERIEKKRSEYLKKNAEHVKNTQKIWRDKKQPLGKLASKRLRIAKSLQQLQKRVDAFKASQNNIEENDLNIPCVIEED